MEGKSSHDQLAKLGKTSLRISPQSIGSTSTMNVIKLRIIHSTPSSNASLATSRSLKVGPMSKHKTKNDLKMLMKILIIADHSLRTREGPWMTTSSSSGGTSSSSGATGNNASGSSTSKDEEHKHSSSTNKVSRLMHLGGESPT
jgi:hypothetical protein